MKQITNYTKIIGYLDRIFNLLNKDFFNNELPKVVISIKNSTKTNGEFSVSDVWNCDGISTKEIEIPISAINKSIQEIVVSLFHAMIHEYCFINNIKDTSRGGAYHNKRFKAEVEKRGIRVIYDGQNGWNTMFATSVIDQFCSKYSLRKVDIEALMTPVNPQGQTRKFHYGTYQSKRYICPCCGMIVRSGKFASLICGDCMEEMILS